MPRIAQVRPAGPDHQVVSIEHRGESYRRKPCSDCPWRKDAVGIFPAEAFRHSAATAYDVPDIVLGGHTPSIFACHQSGAEKPATCAGFLLSAAAEHNLALRIRGILSGKTLKGVGNPDNVDLFPDYYDMAVANGVPPKTRAFVPASAQIVSKRPSDAATSSLPKGCFRLPSSHSSAPR